MTPFDVARSKARIARIAAAELRKHGDGVSDAIAGSLERGALKGLIRIGLPSLEVLSVIGTTVGTWSTAPLAPGLRVTIHDRRHAR